MEERTSVWVVLLRPAEDKRALSHGRLMLGEDRWGAFCGDAAWLQRADEVVRQVLLPACALCLPCRCAWSGTCGGMG